MMLYLHIKQINLIIHLGSPHQQVLNKLQPQKYPQQVGVAYIINDALL